jgi:hypothetical protein
VFKEFFGDKLTPLNETILHPYTNAILISFGVIIMSFKKWGVDEDMDVTAPTS